MPVRRMSQHSAMKIQEGAQELALQRSIEVVTTYMQEKPDKVPGCCCTVCLFEYRCRSVFAKFN